MRKNAILFIGLLAFIVLLLPCFALGDATEGVYKGVNWYINNNGVLSFGKDTEEIPAFSSESQTDWRSPENQAIVRKVIIPDGCKRIGASAFDGCMNLKEVILPRSLEEIGDKAFKKCGIRQLQIPDSVKTIGTYVFDGCALTSLRLPDGLEEIPEGLCIRCAELKNIQFPKSMKQIGKSAFRYCRSISSLNFPEGLLSIKANAFGQSLDDVQDCYAASNGKKSYTSLKALKIPASLETIEKGAFAGCDALTDISFAKDAHLSEIGNNGFALCLRLKKIELPDSVQSIGNSSFKMCLEIKTADLGNGLTEAGSKLFSNCKSLISLTVPDTLVKIGKDLLEEHGEKLKIIYGKGSRMEKYLRKYYPEIAYTLPEGMELKLEYNAEDYIFYAGNNKSHVDFWYIENYDQLAEILESEPSWWFEFDNGTTWKKGQPRKEARLYWSNGTNEGKSIWFNWIIEPDIPAVLGETYTGILHCEWRGYHTEARITIHIAENPNGPLTGISGIKDDYYINKSNSLTLYPEPVPKGWFVPDPWHPGFAETGNLTRTVMIYKIDGEEREPVYRHFLIDEQDDKIRLEPRYIGEYILVISLDSGMYHVEKEARLHVK